MERKSEWFETWFNSPFYPVLYDHRSPEEARSLLQHLTHFQAIKQGTNILDLACGQGRHSLILAEMGYRVTGLDIAPQPIEAATNEAAKGNFDFQPEFFVHDMRKLFRVNFYDYVFNFFTSFGYFQNIRDNFKTLHAVQVNLKPGGFFLLDYLNGEKAAKELIPEETIQKKDLIFEIGRKLENGFFVKNISVSENGQRHDFQERVQAFTKEELAEMLSKSGLKPVSFFGDYSFNQFNPLHSPRCIILAQKEVNG